MLGLVSHTDKAEEVSKLGILGCSNYLKPMNKTWCKTNLLEKDKRNVKIEKEKVGEVRTKQYFTPTMGKTK